MNRIHIFVLSSGAALSLLLSGCVSTPKRMEELEAARAHVTEVETSPRAGVAATDIAEARKSLDRANRLAESSGTREDIEFEAGIASKYAQIANEKILTAQAREEIEKGTAERQAVLIQAREREAQLRGQQARQAQAQANAAVQRASTLEQELADLKAEKTDRGIVVTLGDVLFERGVAASQITTRGMGETTPVANNDDAGGRQQNRRVELVFQESSRVATDVQ